MKPWSNLATVVYGRTYARKDGGRTETWEDTVERVIHGNVRNHKVSANEVDRLRYLMLERKAMPAGRGLWYSGAPGHKRLGGVALNNCWGLTAEDWNHFVLAQDLLMLGGGVGMTVEHRYVSKLPRVKRDVKVQLLVSNDADFIIPDSREGWCELTRRILEAHLVTGKSFSYSTVCIRGAGEPIKGFGGSASGPIPIHTFTEKLQAILSNRAGKALRPIDAADMLCAIAELIVSGNVRRSALMILGDAFDKDFLKAKRWDLGNIPTQRAMGNFSVVADDVEDLHPLFWKTYETGEPFGVVNRTNMQKFGRMGELKTDSSVVVNPCQPAWATILTPQGISTIGEVKVGDVVWSGNGWTNITAKWSTGIKPIFRYHTRGGSFIGTENHRIVQNGVKIEVKDAISIDVCPSIFGYAPSGINKIDSISFLGEEEVFDLTVAAAEHTYWSDGLLVSNCAEATLENAEPCVAYDTPIITKNGIEQIGALVGSFIEIWNGLRWSQVTPRLTGTDRKLYRVHLSDGSYLDATNNHGFSVKHRFQDRFTRVRTDELTSFSKYPVQFEPFDVLHNDGIVYGDAYDMGVAVGDGCFDDDVVNVFLYGKKQRLPLRGTRGPAYLKPDLGRNVDTVRVRCEHLDATLFGSLKYGTGNDLAVLAKWDRASLLNFFAGWIDTDGSLTSSGGVRLYISNAERASIAQLLLSFAGVKSSKNLMSKKGTITNKGVRSDDMYYLQITDGRSLPCKRVDTSRGHKPRTKGMYQTLVKIEELPGLHNTYCFEEPERHMGVFGNVLTYQCNLQEIALPNIESEEEFIEAARLMHRWGKRVTMEKYHQPKCDEVVKRNRRIGTGITGVLQSSLFNPATLDRVYAEIQEENRSYAKELGIPESIRTTVIKPSGTLSKLMDCAGEGVHPAFSRYMIQRVRFGSGDPLVPLLREAGHYVEPQVKFDGSLDRTTVVADFYIQAPEGTPVADEDWNTWKQLDIVKLAQKHWADQSVSVTVYYKREEIPQLKIWLTDNLKYLKTISFLCHNDHGFKQAPKEAISREQFEKLSSKVKPLDYSKITGDSEVDGLECASGSCPIK